MMDTTVISNSDHESNKYSEGHTEDMCAKAEPQNNSAITDSTTTSESDLATCPIEEVIETKNGNLKRKKTSKSKKAVVRGRPRKALVTMYHSQISGDKNTIKIKIKKSNLFQVQIAHKTKVSRAKKKKKLMLDDDLCSYDNVIKDIENFDRENKDTTEEPQEQSSWGQYIPEKVLFKIFSNVCALEGSLPALIRFCRVCKLWRSVALNPVLWSKVDLNWAKDRYKNDMLLHWLIINRLSLCKDLTLGDWKIKDIASVLEALNTNCPEIHGLNLSGWRRLTAENLKFIATQFSKLERLDLSSIHSATAINVQPFVNMAQIMGNRLTHLVLANNKLSGFTQIMSAISSNCIKLTLLDISNVKTLSHNTALLNVEKLQIGCPNLRVLRITNSQIWLAPGVVAEQIASPGFPLLEELSLAGIENKNTTARSIDDDGIDRILKSSTKLRLLDIRGCIRLTDSGLVRVPAWDLEHLFLSGCYVTRQQGSGLELLLQKWSHSLLEVDLAWSTSTSSLDAALLALAEKGIESPLRTLNLCGSSISLEPVKAVLMKCPNIHSINLQSCRALPRGIKRLYAQEAVEELRQALKSSNQELLSS